MSVASLRLQPLALGAGDYALVGAVYCLASVFCYARQLLLAKSALAKSGLAAVVCNGIGSPVSSRLPWEHQASSIALQQYLPSRQPWRMCDRCIGSNINLDLLHAVRRRHHDLTLWSRSFVDAQEMTSVSPVKSPSVKIMATGVAVLRTRTWDTLSNLHCGRPDVLSARTRAKLGNTSTSPFARFQPFEDRARTGGTIGTVHSTSTNGRHTARICWVLPRHVRIKRGPSVTDCTSSMYCLRSSPDMSKAASKQCGMDQERLRAAQDEVQNSLLHIVYRAACLASHSVGLGRLVWL